VGASTASVQTALAMTQQLMLSAKLWRKLDGQNRLPEIVEGVESRDGIKHEIKAACSGRYQLFGKLDANEAERLCVA